MGNYSITQRRKSLPARTTLRWSLERHILWTLGMAGPRCLSELGEVQMQARKGSVRCVQGAPSQTRWAGEVGVPKKGPPEHGAMCAEAGYMAIVTDPFTQPF